MKDKGHFCISLAKSVLRIGGCIAACVQASQGWFTVGLVTLSVTLVVAEVLGVLEEVFDKR